MKLLKKKTLPTSPAATEKEKNRFCDEVTSKYLPPLHLNLNPN